MIGCRGEGGDVGEITHSFSAAIERKGMPSVWRLYGSLVPQCDMHFSFRDSFRAAYRDSLLPFTQVCYKFSSVVLSIIRLDSQGKSRKGREGPE